VPVSTFARGALVALVALLATALTIAPDAHADQVAERVTDLTRVLTKSRKEKQRISAAVALGRLRDRRATKPLVVALRKDSSRTVRSVAAAALGHLGDPRALPALRKSLADPDQAVRKRVREAIATLEGSGRARSTTTRRSRAYRQGDSSLQLAPRERPRLGPKPTMLVSIASVNDKSRSARKVSKKWRSWRTNELRKHMVAVLAGTPEIVLDDEGQGANRLRKFSLDVSIEKLQRRENGRWVELECQLRVSVSNERGRMLSFLSGGATVQVPRRTFRKEFVKQMYQDALENAARGVHQDLVSYLSRELRN